MPDSASAPHGLVLWAFVAERPSLFAELDSRFPGGKASDQAIRSYLLTQKFIPAAADQAIRSYRETKQLVEAESRGYSSPETTAEEVVEHQNREVTRSPQAPPPMQKIGSEDGAPYQFWHGPGHLRGQFDITDAASADEVLRAVETWVKAWKLLQRPADAAKKPDGAEKKFKGGDVVPGSTPFRARHYNHTVENNLIEPEEGEIFPTCDECDVTYMIA